MKYLFDSHITMIQCCQNNVTFNIFQNRNNFSYTMTTSCFIYRRATCDAHYSSKDQMALVSGILDMYG